MANVTLITGDHPTAARKLQAHLVEWGHSVAVVSAGPELTRHLSSKSPDAVIVAELMADEAALKLLGAVRQSSGGANARLILLTQWTPEDEFKDQARELHVSEFWDSDVTEGEVGSAFPAVSESLSRGFPGWPASADCDRPVVHALNAHLAGYPVQAIPA